MERYLEVFFRHRRLLVTPIVASLIVSIGLAMMQPRTYEASARVWFQADWFQSSSIGGFPSTLGGGSGPAGAGSSQATAGSAQASATPAEVAKGVFNELLGTRSFCLAVGHRGPLARYLAQSGHSQASDPATALGALYGKLRGGGPASGRPRAADDAVETSVVQKIVVVTSGPQIVTLTFDFPDPDVAAGTLKALLDEFSSEVLASQRTQAQQRLGYINQQVEDQQRLVAGADADVAHYVAQHAELRSLNPPPDAAFGGLQEVADTAHQQYAYLIQQRDLVRFQVNALNTGTSPQFRIIDSPIPPSRPNSLLKTLLSGLAAGLGIGLLVAGAALAILAFVDRTVRTAGDVERSLGLKVVGVIPLLETEVVVAVGPSSEEDRRPAVLTSPPDEPG